MINNHHYSLWIQKLETSKVFLLLDNNLVHMPLKQQLTSSSSKQMGDTTMVSALCWKGGDVYFWMVPQFYFIFHSTLFEVYYTYIYYLHVSSPHSILTLLVLHRQQQMYLLTGSTILPVLTFFPSTLGFQAFSSQEIV